MEQLVKYIANLLWDWPLIVTILSTGIYYTLSSKFFQIKYFKYIWVNIFKKMKKENRDKDSLNTFEILFAAIGTTSGIGNIIGVTSAILIGGPGAIFWLVLTGFLGMIIKIAEVTLAVYYRDEYADGSFGGGPMQYIEKGIGKSMNFKCANILILFFCIGITSTFIFTIQNYNASSIINVSLHFPIILTSILYSVITYIAIYKGINGIKRIFIVTVPIITFIYMGTGVLVILRNINLLFPAIKLILKDAFTISSIVGGIVGHSIHETIFIGVSRAVYSSEAGWGSSSMILSTANTKHPIEQGLWGAIEVFFDTIIICSTTGLVVVIGLLHGISPNENLIIASFSLGIGSLSKIIIPITIFLFALTTSIGWFSYYESILNYYSLRINFKIKKDTILKIMKLIYPLPGLIIVILSNNSISLNATLWNFSDILAGLPTFINMFAILLLSDKFFELLKDYECRFIKKKKSNEHIPLFYSKEEKDYYKF